VYIGGDEWKNTRRSDVERYGSSTKVQAAFTQKAWSSRSAKKACHKRPVVSPYFRRVAVTIFICLHVVLTRALAIL